MLRTLTVPLKVGKRGQLRAVEGSNAIDQTVKVALSPSASTHPWQQTQGIGYDVVFQTADEPLAAMLGERVQRIFARLAAQDIADVAPNTTPRFVDVGDGQVEAEVHYVDLERDDARPSMVRIPSPGRG